MSRPDTGLVDRGGACNARLCRAQCFDSLPMRCRMPNQPNGVSKNQPEPLLAPDRALRHSRYLDSAKWLYFFSASRRRP